MNDQLTETTITTECEQVLDSLARSLEGQLLISQDRCVDGLLDVYNAAPSGAVRKLVSSAITDIQHLSAVRTTDMATTLGNIGAALAIEGALASADPELEIVDDDDVEGAVAEA